MINKLSIAAASIVTSALLLGGCSWFGGGAQSGLKPAELLPIKSAAKVAVVWQGSVPNAGKTVLYPVLAGNTVWAAGANGQIVGFDAVKGAATSRFDSKELLSAGVAASASVVVVATLKGELQAYETSGKQRWKVQVPGEMLAPPVIEGDQVIVRVGDGAVHSYDTTSGKRRWVYQRSAPPLSVRAYAGIVVDRGVVYAGFAGGRLVAMSAVGGSVLWDSVVSLPKGTTELERVADITSAPVVDDGRACAATYQGRTACFEAARGSSVWARDISSFNGMAADFRNIYLTDDKNVVMALDKSTGGTLWRQDRLNGRGLTRPLAFGRYIIVGDFQGYVHLLSRDDGAMMARIATDGSAIIAPPIALDIRSVLVQTRNGGIYALTAE